jgi:hypothetical protein
MPKPIPPPLPPDRKEPYTVTVKGTVSERHAIDAAADALKTSRSALARFAITDALHALGIKEGEPLPAPLAKPWPYRPVREEETPSDSGRFIVNLGRESHFIGLFEAGAKHVDLPPPRFIVGATLRYIRALKLTPQYAALLSEIPLPPPFDR